MSAQTSLASPEEFIEEPPAEEPAEAQARGADAETLRRIVSKLADEASTLGIDLVDIAGAIQDVAAMSKRHASTFDQVTRTALSIAETNKTVASSLRATDETAVEARRMLGESSARLSGAVGKIDLMVAASQEISTEIGSFSISLGNVDKVAEEIGSIAARPIFALNAAVEAACAKGQGLRRGRRNPHACCRLADTGSICRRERDRSKIGLPVGGRPRRRSALDVRETSQAMNSSFGSMEQVITRILDGSSVMARTTDTVDQQCAEFVGTLNVMAGEVLESDTALQNAATRVDRVVALSETLIQLTASAGIETADSPWINAARDVAAQISATFQRAVDGGRIGLNALFDRNYRPIPGTDPVR
jgi:methyl-accepting chemotaxis protein